MEDPGTIRGKEIFELTEIYDEKSGQARGPADNRNSQQTIVINGRDYERVKQNGERIHDLTEIVEDQNLKSQINEIVMRRAEDIIEKIAREVVPEIAERVIRQEIEKIKAVSANKPLRQD